MYVTATITDNNEVSTAVLFLNEKIVPFVRIEGDLWGAIGEYEIGSDLDYHIEAYDASGNTGKWYPDRGYPTRGTENTLSGIPDWSEFVDIEHYGMVMNGVEDTTSDMVKSYAGAHENYTFTNLGNGSTKLDINVDVAEDFKKDMEDSWPKALEKLKEIAERD
ncbi:MAG: hypothetical protein Q9M91_03560 [Candidatus Dojkabacteria bacterium]|nr:hypothetical protein [Candidatus Dojkabacteria bacterium]MDQ7020898.1 hypothetical protein [Candidatus Dojkabacteria bacterium]